MNFTDTTPVFVITAVQLEWICSVGLQVAIVGLMAVLALNALCGVLRAVNNNLRIRLGMKEIIE